MTATTEFVVPRSIPMILDIDALLCGLWDLAYAEAVFANCIPVAGELPKRPEAKHLGRRFCHGEPPPSVRMAARTSGRGALPATVTDPAGRALVEVVAPELPVE